MWGAQCGWLCWGGWGELSTLFSLVMSLLLQIRADSASWVPAVFKFGGKEPPKLPLELARPSSLGSLMVSSATEAGLLRGEKDIARILHAGTSFGTREPFISVTYQRFGSTECLASPQT